MKTMHLAIEYMGMRARTLGRSIFRNEVGALTLEWIVIAVGVVVAAGIGVVFIKNAIKAESKHLP